MGEPPQSRTLEGLRILVADDSEDMRLLVRVLLERHGATVDEAENGAVAVEIARGRHFDLVLMDLQMPVLDGLSATARLRKLGFVEPIVTMSADVCREIAKRAQALGAASHVMKPFASESLVTKIASLTRASHAPK